MFRRQFESAFEDEDKYSETFKYIFKKLVKNIRTV